MSTEDEREQGTVTPPKPDPRQPDPPPERETPGGATAPSDAESDDVVDEQGRESFPASDPPANY